MNSSAKAPGAVRILSSTRRESASSAARKVSDYDADDPQLERRISHRERMDAVVQ
jgi:hypothetical protein